MRKLPILIALTLLILQSAMAQFSSIQHLAPLPITTDTKEMPQSKIWMHEDRYWAVLTDSGGTFVWRLDNLQWTKLLQISVSKYGRADCKVVGNVVHVFLYRKANSYLISIEYDPKSISYNLWQKRPERVNITLPALAETATIDIDTQNRMWMVYDDSSTIETRWSDPPYDTWSSPILIASGVNPDDIGSIMAFPMFGKMGILWSDQNSGRFGFRMHTDGSYPGFWTQNEVPASQSATDEKGGMANDHLSMALARDGTLYCAVKTGYNQPGFPKIALLVRRPSGTWDDLYEVSETGTRGLALLNEQTGKIRIAYTANEDGGNIYYRESPIDKIAFGNRMTLFRGKYNHCTSIKNNITPNVLILASDSLVTTGILAADIVRLQLGVNPNPVFNVSKVDFSIPGNTNYALKIYNLTGNLVEVLKEGRTKYGERYTSDLEAWRLPFGVYIIRLETTKQIKTLKFVRI